MLRAGADKVSVNTAAVQRTRVDCSRSLPSFGCQCVVVAIDARRRGDMGFEVFTHVGARVRASTRSNGRARRRDVGRGRDPAHVDWTATARVTARYRVDPCHQRRLISPSSRVAAYWDARSPRRWRSRSRADAVLAASIVHFGEHTGTKPSNPRRGAGSRSGRSPRRRTGRTRRRATACPRRKVSGLHRATSSVAPSTRVDSACSTGGSILVGSAMRRRLAADRLTHHLFRVGPCGRPASTTTIRGRRGMSTVSAYSAPTSSRTIANGSRRRFWVAHSRVPRAGSSRARRDRCRGCRAATHPRKLKRSAATPMLVRFEKRWSLRCVHVAAELRCG